MAGQMGKPRGASGIGRRSKGFRQAGKLVERPVKAASEGRGFAVTRLLTHWEEIVGADVARVARPVEVSYARGGFGATLTVLTTGAQAPMLQMQEPRLRERINACYGYAAIARLRFTQTAPRGFSEGQAQFGPAQQAARPAPTPAATAGAETMTRGVADEGLRHALARLGAQVLTKPGRPRGA